MGQCRQMGVNSIIAIRVLLVLLVSLPTLGESCGDAHVNTKPQKDTILANGFYRSLDTGFEYRIPKGITASTDKSFNSDGSYVILTGTGTSARMSVTVRNGDNTLVTPESHLRKMAELSGIHLSKISTLPFDPSSTSDTWHRGDYKSYDKGTALYSSLLSVRDGAQWLDWTFTAGSKKQLEFLVASLATVKLYMSAGVSGCLDFNAIITRYRVSGKVMQQYLLKSVPPVYPAGWHRKGIVVLQAAIDKKGKVASLRVIDGDDADLADSALAAARQYEYQPYTVKEQPVDVDTEITIEFANPPGTD